MWKAVRSLSMIGTLVACGGGDDDGGGDGDTTDLVGTWRTADDDMIDAEYTFRDDGSVTFVGRNGQGDVTLQIDGTFEADGSKWTLRGTDQDGVNWFLDETLWFDDTRLAVTALLPEGEVADGPVGRWSGQVRVELDEDVLRDSDVTYDLAAGGSASLRVREGKETTTVPAAWEIEDDRVRVTMDRDGSEVVELWAIVEGEAMTGTLLFRVERIATALIHEKLPVEPLDRRDKCPRPASCQHDGFTASGEPNATNVTRRQKRHPLGLLPRMARLRMRLACHGRPCARSGPRAAPSASGGARVPAARHAGRTPMAPCSRRAPAPRQVATEGRRALRERAGLCTGSPRPARRPHRRHPPWLRGRPRHAGARPARHGPVHPPGHPVLSRGVWRDSGHLPGRGERRESRGRGCARRRDARHRLDRGRAAGGAARRDGAPERPGRPDA